MHTNGKNGVSVPETAEIDDLLGELMPAAPAPTVTGRRILGAWPLGKFLQGVNWLNAANFASPFRTPVAAAPFGQRVLGAIPLGAFLAGVNWQNQPRANGLAALTGDASTTARMVVDSFMDEIKWD
ncbi:MAG: hypothetical protein K2R98_25610 [Gemmataceae bacterium]|nr:hypothetical protein [Gemmataceae bacterium]